MKSDLALDLRAHLQTVADLRRQACLPILKGCRYGSIEDLVLAEGKLYSDEPLTADDRRTLQPVIKRIARARPWIKECYMNAYHVAEAGEACGVRYAEGYALKFIPVMHAWATFNGRAIDVTWREYGDRRTSVAAVWERIERNIAESPYMGFEVPLAYLRDLQRQQGHYTSAIDDWKNVWPLVRRGLVFEFEREEPCTTSGSMPARNAE